MTDYNIGEFSINIVVPEPLNTKGKTYVAKPPTYRAMVWDGSAESVDVISTVLGQYNVEVKYVHGRFDLFVRMDEAHDKFKLVEKGMVFVVENKYDFANQRFPFFILTREQFLDQYEEFSNDA